MFEAQKKQQLPWLKTQNAFNTIITSMFLSEMFHSFSIAFEFFSISQTF